ADQVLHHEIELALFGLADVVDVDDVRVVDAVRRARLAKHPRAKMRLAAQIRANQFQRDDAIDEHVASAIDDAHSAFTRARFESIAPRDDAAEHRIRRLHRLGHTLRLLHSVGSLPLRDTTPGATSRKVIASERISGSWRKGTGSRSHWRDG